MQGTRRRPVEGPGGLEVAADPGRVEKAREGAEVQAPGARPRPLGPGQAPLDPARHGRPLPPGGAGLRQPMSAGGPREANECPSPRTPSEQGGAGFRERGRRRWGGGEEPLPSSPASRPPAAPPSFSSQNPAPLGLSAARLSFLLSARRAARRVKGGSGAPLPPPPFPETPWPAAGGWDASLLCGVPDRLPARLCWRPGVRGAAARLPAFVPRAPWTAPPPVLDARDRGGGVRERIRQRPGHPQSHASPPPGKPRARGPCNRRRTGRNGGWRGLPARGEVRASPTALSAAGQRWGPLCFR